MTDLKKSYVDVLGNAGKTVPSQAKEVAPPQMDMQFFNPQAQQPQVKNIFHFFKLFSNFSFHRACSSTIQTISTNNFFVKHKSNFSVNN